MFGLGRIKRFQSYRDPHPLVHKLTRLAGFLVVAVILYEIITSFLIFTLQVDSLSMSPQYEPGTRLAASTLPFGPSLPFRSNHIPGFSKPKRGDVVILRPRYFKDLSIPEKILRPMVRMITGQKKNISFHPRQEWEQEFVMKRVIALPGDTVRIRKMEAFVRPKGTPDFVSEFSLSLTRYDIHKDPLPAGWKETDPLGGTMDELILKDNEYFVLGDNRSLSTDSRLSGPVPLDRIYAKVLFRYWPIGKPKKQ